MIQEVATLEVFAARKRESLLDLITEVIWRVSAIIPGTNDD